jgi:isopenicillin-N epimerase
MQDTEYYRSLFLLNEEYTYLNYGSFGACPKPIFDDYQKWQRALEYEPVNFITNTGLQQLDVSKQALAEYINCDADDLVFTTNPTYAMNIVIKSFKLEANDEVLATDGEYGALDRTWEYYCEKSGAKYIRQPIPLPIQSKENFIEAFWAGYSKNTKAIFISQITSATGLILPVKEICARAKELGLITIVDGAHVPGHIKLDLKELEADMYTGACHKWMLAPKGCSFLYAKPEFQKDIDPLVVSWGYKSDNPGPSQFIDYHQQQGTRDFSAFLTVPACIDFMDQHDWKEVSNYCKKLVRENVSVIANTLDSTPISPISTEFLGQLCSLPIRTRKPIELKNELFNRFKIEIPVVVSHEATYIRYSVQAFNGQNDLDRLNTALRKIKTEGNLLY